MSATTPDSNPYRSATDRAGTRYQVTTRTGYGSFGKPGHSRLDLIATTPCRTCGVERGQLCLRADGSDRVSVHRSRWSEFRGRPRI